MFKIYGILGLILIIFAEVTMFLRAYPFLTWFTPTVWFGYILLVDSIVYTFKGNSLLVNRKLRFLQLLLVSINFWFLFEIYNEFIHGWFYTNLPESKLITFIMGTLSFATIVPAVFETWEMVEQLHLFTKVKFKFKILTNKYLINAFIVVGIIFLILPLVIVSPWVWVLVWTGFIFLIDPILYLSHDEKSLIMQVKKKKFNTIISLFIAGYICGFLWEFWNYWAYTKWYYTVPILENIKVFEIPVVGFLAYGPFALELYVMYNFVRFLLSKKIWSRV